MSQLIERAKLLAMKTNKGIGFINDEIGLGEPDSSNLISSYGVTCYFEQTSGQRDAFTKNSDDNRKYDFNVKQNFNIKLPFYLSRDIDNNEMRELERQIEDNYGLSHHGDYRDGFFRNRLSFYKKDKPELLIVSKPSMGVHPWEEKDEDLKEKAKKKWTFISAPVNKKNKEMVDTILCEGILSDKLQQYWNVERPVFEDRMKEITYHLFI